MNIERTGKKNYRPISVYYGACKVSLFDACRKELCINGREEHEENKHDFYITLSQEEIDDIARYASWERGKG